MWSSEKEKGRIGFSNYVEFRLSESVCCSFLVSEKGKEISENNEDEPYT